MQVETLAGLVLDALLVEGLLGGRFAAADLFLGVHGAAAVFRAAVADCFVVAAVVEAVVVSDLVAGGQVPDRRDPHPPVLLAGLAVGVATVVDEHGRAVAVDDDRAVAQSKEIGDGRVLVAGVGLLLGEAAAGVLGHAGSPAHRGRRVAACGVYGGRADDESHANVRCFP